MFYLLVMVSFAYLIAVLSLISYAFLFYLRKDNLVQCFSVLSDLNPTNGDNSQHMTK